MDKDIFDISGWILGVVSFIYALHQTHKGKIDQIMMNNKIKSLEESLLDSHESQRTLSKTVHDICFNALMQVKNYPLEEHDFSLQRETLVATLRSVQRVAQSYSKDQIFEGSFTIGSDLSSLEMQSHIKNIWILTTDFLPEKEDPELIRIIKSNSKNGKKYVYIYPDYIDSSTLDHVSGLLGGESESLVFKSFNINDHPSMNFSSTIVIYESSITPSARGERSMAVCFEEVIVPDERRGGLWRRQADVKANSILTYMKRIINT